MMLFFTYTFIFFPAICIKSCRDKHSVLQVGGLDGYKDKLSVLRPVSLVSLETVCEAE